MCKHLVICTDGTWNRPDQKDRDRVVPTNVAEVARAVSGKALELPDRTAEISQLVYYDTGVGTGVGLVRKCLEGISGFGFRKKVIHGYQAIAKVYEPGDKLFLFGFSRGAYTARSLARLIGLCGIPDASNGEQEIKELTEEALNVYRITDAATRKEAAKNYINKYAHKMRVRVLNEVHFIGVWDTVGALGVPWWPFRWFMRNSYTFHDVTLGSHIKNAYHAVAIDERRRLFSPTLWLNEGELFSDQQVEQVWFPGVHANVGGGYVDSGLADRALLWMCLKAAKAGLGFKSEYMNLRVDPNYHGEIRESCRYVYKLTAKTRRIGGKWAAKNTKSQYSTAINEKIHYSAQDRFEHATEIAYRRKHNSKSLGHSLKNEFPRIAEKVKGEANCHNKLTAKILNDGGGTPSSFAD